MGTPLPTSPWRAVGTVVPRDGRPLAGTGPAQVHLRTAVSATRRWAGVAVQSSQQPRGRAEVAARALAAARAQVGALGAARELENLREAMQIGLDRAMSSSSLLSDDRRRTMAAIVRESRRNGLDPLL